MTIRDVVKACGLGVGTVSRVLNNQNGVSPEARRRVQAAIRSLGYVPDGIARSLRTRSTRAIGFMIPDISNPLFAAIAKSAEEVLHDAGYSLVLANTANRPEREIELISLFQARQLDALIMTLSREDDSDVIEGLARIGMPVVLLDREVPIEADRVISDHGAGMHRATEYLLQLGHRRIGLITLRNDVSSDQARIRGFLNAHQAAAVPVDPKLLRHIASALESGVNEAVGMLSLDNRPTALIAGSNQIFVGVCRAIHQGGYHVPEDLSVIACDDTPMTELMHPPTTVISRDLAEVGRMAAYLLLDRLRGIEGGKARRIVIPTELVLRASCAAPALSIAQKQAS